MLHLAAMAAGLALAGVAGVAGAPKADPTDGIYTLKLVDAFPGPAGKPGEPQPMRSMTMYLDVRDGKTVRAFGKGYCNIASAVDASDVTVDGKGLHGKVAVTIASDGWGPVPGTEVRATLTLSATAAGAEVTGDFEGRAQTVSTLPAPKTVPTREIDVRGKLTGTLAPRPSFPSIVTMRLHMEHAVGAGSTPNGKQWDKRAFPLVTFKDRKPTVTFIAGHGGRAQINYFEGIVEQNDLVWGDGTLTGAMRIKSHADIYVYTLDCLVIGDQVAGTYAKRINDKDHGVCPIEGVIVAPPAVPIDNAVYYLEFMEAVPKEKALMSYVPVLAGKFGAGVAYAGTWNHTYHDVDAAGLTLVGNRLSGVVNVTMNPDPYMPADRKPVPASYTIDATVADGFVTGTYQGDFKGEPIKGKLIGELAPVPTIPEPVAINLKLDNGVIAGAPWFRRVYCGFLATGGKADKGGVSNNKGGWQGRFTKAEIAFEGTTFTATIWSTVDTSAGSWVGDYMFKVRGKVVGEELIGKCDTWYRGPKAHPPTTREPKGYEALEYECLKKDTDVMGGFQPAR
jgi:hypothetical protein